MNLPALAKPPVEAAQDNANVAQLLREAAALLESQQANPFRVAAYRNAARSIAEWPESVRAVFDRAGRAGLDELPAVGPGIAAAVAEIMSTGRWGQLDRLRGADPHLLFQAVPGIGPELAQRIHDELGIDTLEGLEIAASNGRLAHLRGVGARRARAIAAVLGELLDRGRRRRAAGVPAPAAHEPAVEMLLAIDGEYRALARPASFRPSRHAVSILAGWPGCPCGTRNAARGTSPRCTPTRAGA